MAEPFGNLPDHSPLGASGAYRWMVCPGSVRLAIGYKDEASPFAAEGTRAHALAQTCLLSGDDAWEWINTGNMELADPPSDEAVSKDMADAVQVYLDSVRSRYPDRNQGNFFVEYGFHCPEIHPLFYGQSDLVYVDEEDRRLDVDEYKHGAGIVIDVQENPQSMYYACGVLDSMNLWDKIDKVTLRIVQPRGWHQDGPIRAWSISTATLWQWQQDYLLPAMHLAETSMDTKSGEHCRFCPVRYRACPQMQEDFNELEELMDLLAKKGGAKALSNPQIGRILSLGEVVKIAEKAAQETAFARMSSGKIIPGRKLVRGKINRAWKDGAEDALVGKFGKQAFSDPKLLTPAKIEKLPEGEALASEWSEKPIGSLVVVNVSDKRAAVNTDTKSLFKDMTKEK